MTTLSLDQIRAAAPSVFAERPWDGTRPDTYRFVPTHEVLELMQDQGFRVTRAIQSRSRIEGKAGFTRHMLRLRHADFLDPGRGGEVPEIVLVNSHDRSSAYRLFSGVFRLVCANGLIVQSADFGSFSIRHCGRRDLFAQIKDATARIMDGIPDIMRQIDGWKGIDLDRPGQLAFAAEAWTLRPTPSIEPADLLGARRAEDAPREGGFRDLWTTSQVIQEHLIRGGLSGSTARGRRVTTRAIRGVTADLAINRSLWELTQRISLN
ncbi:MAG TPA: DUF932 domain-containing protein [Isosphaeraceae bacterium]|nr:DUF932 domain-containing protein [Isosphaeraceae bacterium]